MKESFGGFKPGRPVEKNRLTLEKLLIDKNTKTEDTQGFGYERFNETQKKDLGAVLAEIGIKLDNPALTYLMGEDLMNIMDYVKTPPGARRNDLKKMILEGIQTAIQKDVDAETRLAA